MKVLLTGSTSGVGLDLLKVLMSEGHEVYSLSRSPLGKETLDECLSGKGALHHFIVDFTNLKQVSSVLDDERFKDMDVIINNAGITLREDITNHTFDDVQNIMNVNATSPMMVIQACMNYDKPQRYINVLSGSAVETFRKLPVYGSAKAAMFKFSEQLVKDWDDLGVTQHQVVDVLPGPIDTKLCPDHYKQNPVLTPKQVADCVMEYVEAVSIPTHLVRHINI